MTVDVQAFLQATEAVSAELEKALSSEADAKAEAARAKEAEHRASDRALRARYEVAEVLRTAINELGVDLFLDPEYAPLAAHVYDHLRTTRWTPVRALVNDLPRLVAPVALVIEEGTTSMRVMIILGTLLDSVDYRRILDFTTTLYGNYCADHDADAALEIQIYRIGDEPILGNVQLTEQGWRAGFHARDGRHLIPTQETPTTGLRDTLHVFFQEAIAGTH